MENNRFCYTLDVLTDGSEHTGFGSLFLSVWKIPLSARASVADSNDADESISTSSESDDDSSCSTSSANASGDDDGSEEESVHHDHRPRATENNRQNTNPYAWLTTDNENDIATDEVHVPVVRYALSGLGDATARLCADQGFKLNKTRACFLPNLSGTSAAADGLSALFYAISSTGSPSLHVVVPASFDRNRNSNRRLNENNRKSDTSEPEERSGAAFVEELATITFGARQKFDIRTCEVREPDDDEANALTWWKVYEDEHLLVHASSTKGLSSSSGATLFSSGSALVYLYSFPVLKPKGSTSKASYCTLALFPPRCGNTTSAYEQLSKRQNLPMIEDGVPMTSIDFFVLLDPSETDLDGMTQDESSSLFRNTSTRVLITNPRNSRGRNTSSGAALDEGILMRSQRLHRCFHDSMPFAFVEPLTHPPESNRKHENNKLVVLQSGTSIVLEKPRTSQDVPLRSWDRRKRIRNRDFNEDTRTKESLDSLRTFIHNETKPSQPSLTSKDSPDGNEIELDEDDNEIDLGDDQDEVAEDENEIDLDDDDDSDHNDDDKVENKSVDSNEIDIDQDAGDEKDVGNGENFTAENNSSPTDTDNTEGSPNSFKTAQDMNPHGAENSNAASRGRDPRLVVLGTGCATPSAYRGASGYALVLPNKTSRHQPYCFSSDQSYHHRVHGDGDSDSESDDIYILDCGEGVSTMLSRNCGHISDWRSRVRGIWISHAHLDHYGGLPNLLRLLREERESQELQSMPPSQNERMSKRPRYSQNKTATRFIPIPWVVAPPKVLRYLDLVLDCHHGRNRNGDGICYEPMPHHDPRRPPGSPFFHYENIQVFHNCCPAFGLLIGWMEHKSGKVPTAQFLCYSGDTRPSHNLVRACRRALQGYGRRGNHHSQSSGNHQAATADLFLIHEATYREEEASMARQKKHSTIAEARQIAMDSDCSRVLLTHFSNRYEGTCATNMHTNEKQDACVRSNTVNNEHDNRTDHEIRSNENGTNERTKPGMGLAVDGLWVRFDR